MMNKSQNIALQNAIEISKLALKQESFPDSWTALEIEKTFVQHWVNEILAWFASVYLLSAGQAVPECIPSHLEEFWRCLQDVVEQLEADQNHKNALGF